MLLDKSLSPVDHRARFDVHLSTVFRQDDERTVVFPEGLTELQKLAYKLEHYDTVQAGQSNRTITEISLHKISILYDYIKSFTSANDIDLRSN